MKIIITGHSGFIGKHLTYNLKDEETIGISRTVLDDNISQNISMDITEIDERKLKTLSKPLIGIDAIIHLSAFRPITRTNRKDFFTDNFEINVLGTLKILMMAKRLGIYKLIFASSKAIYGNHEGIVTENDPSLPTSNYGKSKCLAEQLCKTFSQLYNIKCTSLRVSSVFGPGMQCSLVFADFLNRALKGDILFIHKHMSGYEALDLIYVEDVVNAIKRALYRKQENSFEAFNIAAQLPINTYELANEIITATTSQSKIKIMTTKKRKRSIKLSIKKAIKMLNWSPNYNVRSAIDKFLPKWYCKEFN